jgi:ATP-dependent RNA helicase DDX3X
MHVINYDLPSMEHGGIEEYTHRIGKCLVSYPYCSLLTWLLGRTGRIGHRGVASSFFTERDEPIASVLTRTLLETGQEIPEFLQSYVPEGNKIQFETESDFDPNEMMGQSKSAEAGAWGADAGQPQEEAMTNTWGGNNVPDAGAGQVVQQEQPTSAWGGNANGQSTNDTWASNGGFQNGPPNSAGAQSANPANNGWNTSANNAALPASNGWGGMINAPGVVPIAPPIASAW